MKTEVGRTLEESNRFLKERARLYGNAGKEKNTFPSQKSFLSRQYRDGGCREMESNWLGQWRFIELKIKWAENDVSLYLNFVLANIL